MSGGPASIVGKIFAASSVIIEATFSMKVTVFMRLKLGAQACDVLLSVACNLSKFSQTASYRTLDQTDAIIK